MSKIARVHKPLWEAALNEEGRSWVSYSVLPDHNNFLEAQQDFYCRNSAAYPSYMHDGDVVIRMYMLFLALYFGTVDSSTEQPLIFV